jgi:hypothetical protein
VDAVSLGLEMIFASSLLFNCWEFATRHPGILLVLLGVVGEVVFDWKEMKGRLAWAKRLSALVLIAGLILEFSEAAKSDNEVADTKERTALVVSNNLVLQAKVLELEGKLKPRAITSEQQTNLIACLSRAPLKGKINVFAGIFDAEAVDFAKQISNVLARAGFEVHCPTEIASDAMLTIGPPGANIVVKSVEGPSPVGAYIQRCFLSVGIEMPAINSGDPNFGSNSVEIDIGQK